MKTITLQESFTIMDAMAYMAQTMWKACYSKELTKEQVEQIVKYHFPLFCDVEEIVDVIDEEGDDEDFDDNVDETNYNPFLGQDDIEDYSEWY